MLIQARFIVFALLLLKTSLSFALPKQIRLEYEISRDGKPLAIVKESFYQDGKQYRIESITKGIGIYALLGERKLTSIGEVTDNGLQPTHFELHQGDHPKKWLISDFDWQNNALIMQLKGKTKTEVLVKGTQDLASYAYQFMFNPPNASEFHIAITTGKKLKQFLYQITSQNVSLDIGGKVYQTIHVSTVNAESNENRVLWLAPDQYFLPLKMVMTDDSGNKIEQIATMLHAE